MTSAFVRHRLRLGANKGRSEISPTLVTGIPVDIQTMYLLTPPLPSTTDISLSTAVCQHDGYDGYASGYCQLLPASSSTIIKLFNDFDAHEFSAAIGCFWLPSPADRHWVVITKIDTIRQSRQSPCC